MQDKSIFTGNLRLYKVIFLRTVILIQIKLKIFKEKFL